MQPHQAPFVPPPLVPPPLVPPPLVGAVVVTVSLPPATVVDPVTYGFGQVAGAMTGGLLAPGALTMASNAAFTRLVGSGE